MAATDPKKKRGFFHVCLFCLRWFRITIVFLALIVVLGILYLTEVGLPGFLKRPLLANLKTRGIELQFSRMRWHWFQGIVAEDVSFGSNSRETKGLQLSFKEASLGLDHQALVHRQLKVDAINVRGGYLVWPLAETNQPAATLSLTNFQAALTLLPDDKWELSNLSADFAGARLNLSGDIQHASAIRDWKIFESRGTAPGLFNSRLRHFAETLERVHFKEPPLLNVILHGDARDSGSFDGIVLLKAPAAETPWGNLSDGDLMARLHSSVQEGGPSRLDLRLNASQIATAWASARQFRFNLGAIGDDQLTNLVRVNLDFSGTNVFTEWAQAANVSFKGAWSHSLTNLIPVDGQAVVQVTKARTQWASAAAVRLDLGFQNRGLKNPETNDESWGWWRNLEPYLLNWNCRLERIKAQEFESRELTCAGAWSAPELVVTNLHTEMYRGRLDANGSLNVATRAAALNATSDFDALKIYSALPPVAQNWLDRQELGWETPPVAHGHVNVILPAWTNRHPDWREKVMPTLAIEGDFKVGTASFRQVPVLSAQSRILFTNMVWALPDLVANRPEGSVALTFTSNERNQDYYFGVHSTVDVNVVRGWLGAQAQEVFDRFEIPQPPRVDAELWGRWHDHERIGARGSVTVSNLSYQTDSATYFHGDLAYTNKFLLLTRARLERTNQFLTADGVGFDFEAKKGYLTNGQGVFDPMVIVRAIGPRTVQAIEPYHFAEPPTAEGYGVIPLSQDITTADLHFKVSGGPFGWLRLHSPRVSGLIDWHGETLDLHGMEADFYQGAIQGEAHFDFREPERTEFTFHTKANGVNLHALMNDVSTVSNHLEGTMAGELQIVRANAEDVMSWFGNGTVQIRDGLIWEIPIFGILSPVLDSISPGLGKSRASEGSASFVISNSVVRSDDLQVRSPTITLLYRGTVDFNSKVEAKVEAEIGRDVPVLGPLVSTVLAPVGKLFETRVTGTLRDPKHEPVLWVTRMITPLMHPWRTLFHLLPGESAPGTNAPPKFPSE